MIPRVVQKSRNIGEILSPKAKFCQTVYVRTLCFEFEVGYVIDPIHLLGKIKIDGSKSPYSFQRQMEPRCFQLLQVSEGTPHFKLMEQYSKTHHC